MNERMDLLEARIKSLEDDRERLLSALKQAAKMALSNPIASAAMPREMREGLKVYCAENN